MPRASDIVDFLPARVEGVPRRDLEARLKRLRAARLYPSARAVGDRKAEPVNTFHMVNLILALVGSAEAKYCAEAVRRLEGLTRLEIADDDPVPEMMLGGFLAIDIRGVRRGHPSAIHDIWAVDGGHEVGVVGGSPGDSVREMYSNVVVFGEDSTQSPPSRNVMVRLPGEAIKAVGDFLGPLEDEDA